MSARNPMKSVIAQGTTVVKAVEEALKKADMPVEFFVKLLEDAQAGFLGFGAKKAKVALFFKQSALNNKKDSLLNQQSYENLFDSNDLHKQIEQQIKQAGSSIKSQAPVEPQSTKKVSVNPQENKGLNPRSPMQRRHLPESSKNDQQRSFVKQNHPKPQAKSIEKLNDQQKIDRQSETDTSLRSSNSYRRRRRSGYRRPIADESGLPKSVDKHAIRPLPMKKNDPSKS